MKSQKYWLGIVSKKHVGIGKKNGFAQVCHGKEAPLKRVKKGDLFIYYSPKICFGEKDPYQCFTAFGIVKDDVIYQVKQFENFHPYRRDIEYLATVDAPIHPLIQKLSFIRNKKHWGYVFRFGLIEIHQEDALLIGLAMNIPETQLNEIFIGN